MCSRSLCVGNVRYLEGNYSKKKLLLIKISKTRDGDVVPSLGRQIRNKINEYASLQKIIILVMFLHHVGQSLAFDLVNIFVQKIAFQFCCCIPEVSWFKENLMCRSWPLLTSTST